MPKSRAFDSIQNILGKIIKGGKWDLKFRQYSLFSQWEKIVGTKIAEHANPKIWQGTTLIVEVSNSAWLQELKMMELDVLQKIRETCPDLKIDKIRWTLKYV